MTQSWAIHRTVVAVGVFAVFAIMGEVGFGATNCITRHLADSCYDFYIYNINTTFKNLKFQYFLFI